MIPVIKSCFPALLAIFTSLSAFAQSDPTTQALPIVQEGKRLYRSELTSWSGTDLFLEKYKKRENIGGYFSYVNNGAPTCVFFSRGQEPNVIGTVSFDSTISSRSAITDLAERAFTETEKELYVIRKNALAIIGSDTLFKTFENTSLNLIPLVNGPEKKVYVLTGPKENGIVIFGNDYLLTFDKDNQLTGKRKLHNNIIPVNFGKEAPKDMTVEGTMHSHAPETGEFITATDICTLMLYEKFTHWKKHNVVSKTYLNIWDCQKDQLVVLPMSTIRKIEQDQEKKQKEN